ncbi:hypothetical protein [Sphingomonas cavernae]|uniref:Uncharacterized protein n=1 Tax=Sphingomonas cavernae TaxID=2320861 RepID=A0A418WP28_9SPHN|nr:hypothetical protein [Sphingomonas cavernae]RJF92970.1 hypothetical protein D3876_00855 [Sphingomonas cavernae]
MTGEQERLRFARALDVGTIARSGYGLSVRCTNSKCGHTRIVDAQPLFDLCRAKGWNMHLDHMMNRLKCSRCGAKWPLLKATAQPPDSGPALGPTTDEEWKRLVRRARG